MANNIEQQGPSLSLRGLALAEAGKKPLEIQKYMRDSYNPESNPQGIVNLALAENTLMHEELRAYFEQQFHIIPGDFTYGDGFTGNTRLCNALSSFFNTHFKAHRPVTSDHLILAAGLLPILIQVSRVLADPGDGILLAAPYYQGFDPSFRVQNGVVPVGVPIPSHEIGTLEELAYLERGLQESNDRGVTIKAVLLCNPHNPLGRCYPPDVILAYCRFCETHNLHLISDEIYGLSVFPSNDNPHPEPFVSVLSLDLKAHGVNPSRVHVLYGMSKDFNANGFRAGVLVSQDNPLLIRSLAATAIFAIIASPTELLWSALLTDRSYLPSFIDTNQRRLREAYEYLTSWLTFHELPYIPSSAGHFLMVDMRPILTDLERYSSIVPMTAAQTMLERESALFALLVAHKVMLTQGAVLHTTEAGWFRITFAVRRDFVDIALTRIERALGWKRWSGLTAVVN